MRRLHVVGSVLVIGLAALAGCAADGSGDSELDYLATAPIEAGAGAEGGGGSVKMPAPASDAGSADGSTDSGASDAAPTDAGSGGGADAGGGGGGGGGGLSCNATNTCFGATNLGNVRGDNGSDSLSAQGATSQWFMVRVTEDDNGVFAAPLQMKATLTSPPGTNFDLYVYVPGSDTRECSAVSALSTTSSSVDQAGVDFGEGGTFSNGSADDRWVTVEVRHVSGPCDPSSKWTLSIFGNQK